MEITTQLQNSSKNTSLSDQNFLMFTRASRSDKSKAYGCSLHSIFDESSSNIDLLEIDFPTDIVPRCSSISLVGSCNGLVCVLLITEQKTKHFVIWNPSTGISKKLPDIGMIGCGYKCYGFGFDELSDDYKVVAVVTSEGQTVCSLYSLKSDSWKKIDSCGIHNCYTIKHGILAKGKLHWRSSAHKWEIVAFDLSKEAFEIVERPSFISEGCFWTSLGILGECLLIKYKYDSFVDIWIMKEYGVKESWEKVMTLYQIPSCTDWISPLLDPYCIGPERGFLMIQSQTLMINDVKNRSAMASFWPNESAVYVESLVSPLE